MGQSVNPNIWKLKATLSCLLCPLFHSAFEEHTFSLFKQHVLCNTPGDWLQFHLVESDYFVSTIQMYKPSN